MISMMICLLVCIAVYAPAASASQGQMVGSQGQTAGSQGQMAGSQEQSAGGGQQVTGSQGQSAGSGQQVVGNQEQTAGNEQQAIGANAGGVQKQTKVFPETEFIYILSCSMIVCAAFFLTARETKRKQRRSRRKSRKR